jgi:hypothetical protein
LQVCFMKCTLLLNYVVVKLEANGFKL